MTPLTSKTPDWRKAAPAGVSLAAAKATRTPETSVLTTDMSRILRPQAAYRWLLPTLAAITPQYVEMTLRGALAGNHVQAWELFDLMIDTDPEIASCISELVEGVLKKKLIIEPFHEEDEEATPEAVHRQKVVSAALRRMRPDPAADENDLKGTIRDLLFARYHGQAVLEVDWSAGFGSDAINTLDTSIGSVIAPRATFWVHPVCYAWSMDGRLGLRQELGVMRATVKQISGLARNTPIGSAIPGNVWNTTSYQPRPTGIDEFPEHKFLIGIGKSKAGTALSGSQLRVLAWWWVASNFCGDWLLNLAQLFGIPFRKAKYQSGTPEAIKQEIRDMLQNCGSAGYILTPEGADVDFMEAGTGAGASPQAYLFDFANQQKRKVLLGQTMTGSGVSGAPQGSKAGMSVEHDVKQVRIDAAGSWACDTINQQLVRSIICVNFGDDRLLPTIRLLEEEEGDLSEAQRDSTLISAGLKVGANFMRKKYGIPAPAEGEEILERQAAPAIAAPQPAPGAEEEEDETGEDETETGKGETEIGEDETEDDPMDAADTGAPTAAAKLANAVTDTLAPVLKRLDAISQITDADTQRALLEKLLKDFPAITEAIRADDTVAKTLSPVLSAALIAGLQQKPEARS